MLSSGKLKNSAQKGFTLIELLVVIGILAILFSIVLIAINPARQFGQANDTKKRSDVLQILNTIHQYAAEHSGQLPANMPAKPTVGNPPNVKPFAWNGTDVTANNGNICIDILTTYISAIPVAPTVDNGSGKGVAVTDCTRAYQTGYTLAVDSAGRVTVAAVDPDVNGLPITITR